MPRESIGRRRVRNINGHWHAELDGRQVPLQALAPMSEKARARIAVETREQLSGQRATKTQWENGDIFGNGSKIDA